MRAAISCIGLIFYLCVGEVKPDYDDDSLQAAINAVSQRRRMAQPHEYDPDEYGSQSDALAYLDFPTGDVRLEGPNYNYQMLLSQIRGSNPYSKDNHESQNEQSRSLEEALSEYINNASPDDVTELKRSAFREFAEQPDSLQRLGARGGGDDGAAGFLTSFRERAKPNYEDEAHHKLMSSNRGVSRDRTDDMSEREYLEEYYDALNDAVNTYLQNAVPLDLQKNYKDIVNKRQYDGYDTGYDFFNSPLQGWSKRDKSRAKSYAYGLNLYDDEGSHPNRLHLERAPKPHGGPSHHIMRKRLWRDGSVEKDSLHGKATQRLMLKRSSKNPRSYSSNTRLIRSKKDSHKMSLLHEKTDPNVAKELSGIFMTTKQSNQTKNKTEKAVEIKVKLDTTTKTAISAKPSPKPMLKATDPSESKSKVKQKLGQLEEAVGNERARPIAMTKKSIDWSDYFGIDRRRKKSLKSNVDDNWLLDQYLQAYARENLGKFGNEPQEDVVEKQENYELLMESLREAADAIINKAIKFTGAHEGIKNEQVIEKVREQVMNQLALAYDLENIRRVLEEQKAEYTQEPSNFYKGISEAKEKRVTVKKEKAIHPDETLRVPDENNNLENTKFPKLISNDGDGACAEVNYKTTLCRTMIPSDHSALVTPCVIHSFCVTCSKCSRCKEAPTETQCDANFLELADNVCGESRDFCRYSARHVLPAMKSSQKGITREPEIGSCDLDTIVKRLMECTQNGVML